jgi:hypothetical protein
VVVSIVGGMAGLTDVVEGGWNIIGGLRTLAAGCSTIAVTWGKL